MTDEYYKFQRLYVQAALKSKGALELSSEQSHYLRNVMRKKPGEIVRIFNGSDGEWFAEITEITKKAAYVQLTEKIRNQPSKVTRVHLLFAPLKKNRMDMIIEKCTELGVTDFHPILTNRTEVRTIKPERLETQIIEACEQCDCLTVPKLHPLVGLTEKITHWHETKAILGCIERSKAESITAMKPAESWAFLIGPVGGFDESERQLLTHNPKIHPVSLGENILRAETAAMLCAAQIYLKASV